MPWVPHLRRERAPELAGLLRLQGEGETEGSREGEGGGRRKEGGGRRRREGAGLDEQEAGVDEQGGGSSRWTAVAVKRQSED